MCILYPGTLIKSPTVNIMDYYFGKTNVTVTLEWTWENGITYNFSIHPTLELEYARPRENILLLTIPYNISYHINIVASLCGQYSTTTVVLNYGKPVNTTM